jgi:hypothetical protein
LRILRQQYGTYRPSQDGGDRLGAEISAKNKKIRELETALARKYPGGIPDRDGIHQYFYNFLSFFYLFSKLLLNCF